MCVPTGVSSQILRWRLAAKSNSMSKSSKSNLPGSRSIQFHGVNVRTMHMPAARMRARSSSQNFVGGTGAR